MARARAVLSRSLVATGLLVVTVLCYGLMARAWGSWSGLLANPAPRGALMAGLVLTYYKGRDEFGGAAVGPRSIVFTPAK